MTTKVKNNSAAFVRRARATLNLSQTRLGTILGRTRRSISRYEHGEELPPAVKLAIMHLLNQQTKGSRP